MRRRAVVVGGMVVACVGPCCALLGAGKDPGTLRLVNHPIRNMGGLVLFAHPEDNDRSLVGPGERGMKGYYRRPSKAIEQGGGFFVPGLEDEKIRLVTAAALFVAFVWNAYGAPVVYVQQVVTQAVGFLMIVLLVVQGIPEDILLSVGGGSLSPSAVAEDVPLVLLQAPSFATNQENRCYEDVVKSMIQCVEGINYIVVADNQDTTRLEVGPPSYGGVAAFSVGDELSASLQASLATAQDGVATAIFNPTSASHVPLPRDTCVAAVLQPPSGKTTWVVGSQDASALERELPFLSSLVRAPV